MTNDPAALIKIGKTAEQSIQANQMFWQQEHKYSPKLAKSE